MMPAVRIPITLLLAVVARGPSEMRPTPTMAVISSSQMGASTDREQTADEQVAQVLSRLTFGARLDAWLSQLETLHLT